MSSSQPATSFVLVNESTRTDDAVGGELSQETLAHIASVIEMQLNRDVAPEYGGNYAVTIGITRGTVASDETAIIVRDLSDTPGAAGYHDRLTNGAAVAYVFRDGSNSLTTGGNALSVTLSHEICEIIGDPGANQWADMVSDSAGTLKQAAKELCDAVESFSYEIDGVSVSDFLLPRFFAPGAVAADGKLSFMGKPVRAFETVAADGADYQAVRTLVQSDEGQVMARVTLEGGTMAAHKLARKAHPWSRTSRRGGQKFLLEAILKGHT